MKGKQTTNCTPNLFRLQKQSSQTQHPLTNKTYANKTQENIN